MLKTVRVPGDEHAAAVVVQRHFRGARIRKVTAGLHRMNSCLLTGRMAGVGATGKGLLADADVAGVVAEVEVADKVLYAVLEATGVAAGVGLASKDLPVIVGVVGLVNGVDNAGKVRPPPPPPPPPPLRPLAELLLMPPEKKEVEEVGDVAMKVDSQWPLDQIPDIFKQNSAESKKPWYEKRGGVSRARSSGSEGGSGR